MLWRSDPHIDEKESIQWGSMLSIIAQKLLRDFY